MAYGWEMEEHCQKEVNKYVKKNPLLKKVLLNKIEEIIENPQHYKPLKYDFAGERRVHILKNFVLKFIIDESNKTIKFLFFGHHDEAYKR